MTLTRMKQNLTVGLLIVAFVFGVCINPGDDSATFMADFIKTKGIALVAFLIALYIIYTEPTEHTK